jgi:hypothetical protein
VKNDLTNMAVYTYRNHGYVIELFVGLLIVVLSYQIGRMLNKSVTGKKIAVLNSFEESK